MRGVPERAHPVPAPEGGWWPVRPCRGRATSWSAVGGAGVAVEFDLLFADVDVDRFRVGDGFGV